MRRLLGKLVSFTKQKVEKIDEIIPSALAPKFKKWEVELTVNGPNINKKN